MTLKYVAVSFLGLVCSFSFVGSAFGAQRLISPVSQIVNPKPSPAVNLGRVVQLFPLVRKPDIQVTVTVVDLGGSTDVSPTQEVFFSIYSKGEMFSTDAVFPLGSVFSVSSATRIDGGIYEIEILGADPVTSAPTKQTLRVDAQGAIVRLKAVDCGGEFDCPASENFQDKITLSRLAH